MKNIVLGKKELICLALILIISITIRLYFFNGMGAHDDVMYIETLRKVYYGESGENIFKNLWTARALLYLPAFAIFKILGPGLVQAFAPTFILSILEILVVYAFLRIILDDKTGALIAAFLIGIFPLDVFVSTTFRGDTEVGFYTLLSIFFFGLSQKKELGYGRLLLILSGFSAGIAYNIKELALLIPIGYLGLFIVDSIRTRKIRINYSYIFIGFIIFILFESLFFMTYTGNWHHRYDKIFGARPYIDQEGKGGEKLSFSYSYIPCLLLDIKTDSCERTIHDGRLHDYTRLGGFYYIVFFAIIYLAVKRDKNISSLIIWLLIVLAYFQFGSMSMKQYTTFLKEPRYFTILSGPAFILAGRAASRFLDSKKGGNRWRIIYIILAILATQSFNILSYHHDRYSQNNWYHEELYDFIKDKKDAGIYADVNNRFYLDLMFGLKHGSSKMRHVGRPGYGNLDIIYDYYCSEKHSNKYIILTRQGKNIMPPGLKKARDKKCIFKEVKKPTEWKREKTIRRKDKNKWIEIYHIS